VWIIGVDYHGGFCPSSRQYRQSGPPRARLDHGDKSRGAGTALQIERTLKLKIARMQTDTPALDERHE